MGVWSIHWDAGQYQYNSILYNWDIGQYFKENRSRSFISQTLNKISFELDFFVTIQENKCVFGWTKVASNEQQKSTTYIKIKMPKKGNLPKRHHSVSQNVLLSIDFGNFNTKAKMCEQMAICIWSAVFPFQSLISNYRLCLWWRSSFSCVFLCSLPSKTSICPSASLS